MRKPMPVGVEDFEKLITEEYYYVDKTLFIKEILDQKADVNIFTRPRRFGKTLALSMLKYFFEDAYDWRGNKQDYSELFADTEIVKTGDTYLKHMGKYPVISLTLKSGKQSSFDDCIRALKSNLAGEFRRHSFIMQEGPWTKREKEKFEAYMDEEMEDDSYKDSLKFLSECLCKWYDKKVIILIDEYDVPLEGAYNYGFYEQMVDFIRGLFESTLKTNQFMYFAVITGCLRISKESIFTGMNNPDINSILSANYGEFFGFTDGEVHAMCKEYDLEDKYPEMKEWYNGYLFGGANVYNPWSCIKYIKDHIIERDYFPEAYWVNTSSNAIVKNLIYYADEEQKQAVENLIAGGTITIPVHEDITYDEVYENSDNLWNFMFFTGYFRKVKEHFVDTQRYVTLKIPNKEVEHIYKTKVLSWFEARVREMDRTALFTSVIKGDTALFTKELQAILKTTISFNDYYENFYHEFVAGVLTGMKDYVVKSNREGGEGRSDIFIKPIDREEVALVLELKVAESLAQLQEKAEEVIRQIKDRNYEQELLDDGYIKTKRYGIAFFKKNCLVISM